MGVQAFSVFNNYKELYDEVVRQKTVKTKPAGEVIYMDDTAGYAHADWDNQDTGDITVNLDNAVEGGCAVMIWSGDTNPNIAGCIIQSYSGLITQQGTYSIYFHYLQGRMNVNIFNVEGTISDRPDKMTIINVVDTLPDKMTIISVT